VIFGRDNVLSTGVSRAVTSDGDLLYGTQKHFLLER
jgi:hypothetical protein